MADRVEPDDQAGAEKPKPSLARRIFIALCLGVALGLFLGELCAPFGIVADAFIGLLEMTVLPYIVVALIANLARLSLGTGLRLVSTAAKVLGVLWLIGLAGIVIVPMALPDYDQGSFFSAAFVEQPTSVDFLELFIPTNVFFALTSNLVPAIVLFCICVGLALITVKDKQKIIGPLDAMSEALQKVNGYVVKLTPYGVFAIGASTAGTMDVAELGRLQAYLLIYSIFVGIMTFGIIPLLITSTTPFGYRQVMRAVKAPMLTAFVTGKVLVVLPFLIDATKELFRTVDTDHDVTDADVEVLYPLAYPFPHLGKLAGLIFIPFTAWFVGSPLGVLDYPVFLVAGLFSYFGGPVLATPFLLDIMQLPRDMMQLFFASGVIAARLGDALAVMHFVALAVISTSISVGLMKINWRALIRGGLIWGGVGMALLVGTRILLTATFADDADKPDVLAEMELIGPLVDSRDVDAAPNPTPIPTGEPAGERIRVHGALRVGLIADRIPFSYRIGDGDWVGYDVNMAHSLAREYGVGLELMEIRAEDVQKALDEDWCDLVGGGLVETLPLLERVHLTDPYMHAVVAGVVLDYRVDELGSFEKIQALDEIRIAIDDLRYAPGIKFIFPNAEVVDIDGPEQFFEGEVEADMLVTIAESAFPWTMRHPKFQVINPLEKTREVPLVYGLNARYERVRNYVNRWIALTDRSGVQAELRDYWVLGKSAKHKPPRWSIIRDVFGWID